MFFNNLTIFRFPATLDLSQLDTQLADFPLRPVGPLELSTRGFVSPHGPSSDKLSITIGNAIWIAVGGEDKLLPASVVNAELAKKVAAIEQAEGRRPGGRKRKQMKEDLVHELLPRAFVRPTRTDAMIDTERGLLYVNSLSRKAAEAVASEVRQALGSFPALPLNAEVSPRSVLTGWVAGEPLPDGVTLGDEAKIVEGHDHGAVGVLRSESMDSEVVERFLESGRQVTHLSLYLDDHVSFVLGEDLLLRKLKFLDGAIDTLEGSDNDDLAAELDARFALMAGELGRLFDVLEGALKLSTVS